jgi:N-acetylneuraminate synthase
MTRAFVIAEVGVNHDGNLDRAKELVEAAADIGADAVKFQTFVAEKLVNRSAAKADYQVGHSKGETQFEMLKHLELSTNSHYVLSRLASKRGIEFISTPFDLDSLAFLATDIGVKRIKISSGDLTNLPLLHSAGQTGLPMIVSTGMATIDEVSLGVGAVAHGRALRADRVESSPSPYAFEEVMSMRDSASLLGDVTLLQCTSEYPAPDHETNLLAMQELAHRFSLHVGLSDHSLGIHLSVAAVALGARVVEKHLTLDNKDDGPDHRASLEVGAFGEMIDAIRSVERALGSGLKMPSPKESENAKLVRRGLYAARNLSPGDVVTESDIAILRPENNVSPSRYWEIVGSPVGHVIARGGDLIL